MKSAYFHSVGFCCNPWIINFSQPSTHGPFPVFLSSHCLSTLMFLRLYCCLSPPRMEESCSLSRLWQLQSVSHRQNQHQGGIFKAQLHHQHCSLTYLYTMKNNWAAVSCLWSSEHLWVKSWRCFNVSALFQLFYNYSRAVLCSLGSLLKWREEGMDLPSQSCVTCLVHCLALKFNSFPAGLDLEPFKITSAHLVLT